MEERVEDLSHGLVSEAASRGGPRRIPTSLEKMGFEMEERAEEHSWDHAAEAEPQRGPMKEDLRLFQTIEPENVRRVQADSEWEAPDLAVDSGASETVIGEERLPGIPTKMGQASKRGVQY